MPTTPDAQPPPPPPPPRRRPITAPRGSRPPARDRLIDATADLLHRQGYVATGLAEVTAASGAPKGSLYFHFPAGKQQLGAAALQRSTEQMLETIEAAAAQAGNGPGTVQSLIATLSNRLQASDFQRGCPVATTALETSATSPPLREATQKAFGVWLEALRLALQADGRDPAIADEQALFALSAIEGALVLARAARSTRPLRVVSRQLAAALGARHG